MIAVWVGVFSYRSYRRSNRFSATFPTLPNLSAFNHCIDASKKYPIVERCLRCGPYMDIGCKMRCVSRIARVNWGYPRRETKKRNFYRLVLSRAWIFSEILRNAIRGKAAPPTPGRKIICQEIFFPNVRNIFRLETFNFRRISRILRGPRAICVGARVQCTPPRKTYLSFMWYLRLRNIFRGGKKIRAVG